MKTVSAEIVSSKPISLSRAAKFLSNFVEFDNGATRATSTYLRNSSDAFNELCEFHKKLKSSKSDRRSSRSHGSSGVSAVQVEHDALSAQSSEGEMIAEKSMGRKNTKEEAEIEVNGSETVPSNSHVGDLENGFDEISANDVQENSEAVTEKKKHKKKPSRKDQDIESTENGGKTSVPNGLGEGGAVDLPVESTEKKSKRKKKGQEGQDSLPPNDLSMAEMEISEARSGSVDGKKERKIKRKAEEGEASLGSPGVSTERHRNKRAK